MRRLAFLAAAALAAGPAAAEPPRVVADIPPVQSIVARVMGDVATPELLVQPGASPHGYSLRPSEARALQEADLVVWTSARLTPWLADPLATLDADTRVIALLELDGTTRLAFRDGATFDIEDAADGHGHDGHEHGEHEHAAEAHADHDRGGEAAAQHDHAEHDHAAEAHAAHDHGAHAHDGEGPDHAEHAHDHGPAAHDHGGAPGQEGHAHAGTDPHAWLDPENAKAWTRHLAEVLAELDQENADTYRANAQAALADLDALQARLGETLAPVAPGAYLVFHDAFHYFENRFGVPAAGAISLSDASDPSPARIAELRDRVAELGIACVFSEPQFNPGLVESVFGEGGATTAVLDPLGVGLEPGPGLYPALMERMARSLADCAG